MVQIFERELQACWIKKPHADAIREKWRQVSAVALNSQLLDAVAQRTGLDLKNVGSSAAALDAAAVIAHCRERLTAYKVPKIVEFRDELPNTNVGKILRRELR